VGVVIVFVTQAGARVTDAVGDVVAAITGGAGEADAGGVGGAGEGAGAVGNSTRETVQQDTMQGVSNGLQGIVHESRYSGDERTAEQIINDDKKGTINSRFPTEWKDKSPDEIYRAAKKGDKKARTAKKLLDGKEYDKTSNK
jgi:hypothetical protein